MTKSGRFRPNEVVLRTVSGPVFLHRSSVNRFKNVLLQCFCSDLHNMHVSSSLSLCCRGEANLPSRWLTFYSAVKSNGNVFIRDSSVVHPLALLLFTDCDITETGSVSAAVQVDTKCLWGGCENDARIVCVSCVSVNANTVVVSFPGRSLMRCELSVETWELLWDLRTAVQTMLHRNLNDPLRSKITQDGQLISLLVELLNGTVSNPLFQKRSTELEVD